jgi:hypothetical protein
MGNPLLPREHGAYGQLAVPLLTGLVLAHGRLAALSCAAAAVAAFLAHEPLLVMLGHRGPKAKRELGSDARVALIRALVFAGLFGAAGFAIAPLIALEAGLPAIVLGAAVIILVFRRRERSLLGEVLVAATLSATLLPVALAGGAPPARALAAFAVFAVGFALVTMAVRGVIARAKKNGSAALAWSAAAASALALAAIAVGLHGSLRVGVALGVAPFAAFAIGMAVVPAGPRMLTKLGWSLVVASVLASVLVVVGTTTLG